MIMIILLVHYHLCRVKVKDGNFYCNQVKCEIFNKIKLFLYICRRLINTYKMIINFNNIYKFTL
jgi:hypothetical protein